MTHLEAIRAGLVIVRDALSEMEEDVLRREYGDKWWKTAVLLPLERDGKLPYGWPEDGNAGDLDLQTALKLVSVYHWELFADTFDWNGKQRSFLQVMIAIRNQYEGHVTPNREKELTASVTDELLEGMARFLRMFNPRAAKKLDRIEVPRDDEIAAAQTKKQETAQRRPVRIVREAAPARDPDDVIDVQDGFGAVPEDGEGFRDHPLTEDEKKKIEDSGYRSLWDQEDEEPITFYSRKPAPPPPPAPKMKPVLYRGVRMREERTNAESVSYGTLNLKDLRARERRRQADARAAAQKVLSREVPTEPEPEPVPVIEVPKVSPTAAESQVKPMGRGRKTPGAASVREKKKSRVRSDADREETPVFDGQTAWERDMERVDVQTRNAIVYSLKKADKQRQQEKKRSVFSGRQKLLIALLIAGGVILGVGWLLLDRYLSGIWFGG